MNGKKSLQEKIFQCLSALALNIDEVLRFGDLRSNRTAGGFLDRACKICRHSYQYLALPALVSAIIVMGIPEMGVRLLSVTAAFFVSLFFSFGGPC